jgi:hypothetical protein
MCRVRSAAVAMKISEEAIVSQPALWCSPIHASSYPRWSSHWMSSRSRWMASVGFSPSGWNGAMKMPNFMRAESVMAVRGS